MNVMGIEINKAKVFAFFADPKTQTTIRTWVAAPSGFIAIKLSKWFGVDTDALGMIATWAIYIAPYVVVFIWSLAQKTHKAIIAQAAAILAKHQSGTIIVNANATDGVLSAVKDPALTNVLAAGTGEARQAATGV